MGKPASRWGRFRQRVNRLFSVNPEIIVLWGFGSVTEFWICAAPYGVLTLAGILSLDLMLVVYGIAWFFGAYILLIIFDVVTGRRKQKRDNP